MRIPLRFFSGLITGRDPTYESKISQNIAGRIRSDQEVLENSRGGHGNFQGLSWSDAGGPARGWAGPARGGASFVRHVAGRSPTRLIEFQFSRLISAHDISQPGP